MKKFKIGKINAAFLTLILITSMLILPMSGAFKISTNKTYEIENINKNLVYIRENNDPNEPIWLDTNYIPKGETLLADEQNDIGYNIDTGNRIQKSPGIRRSPTSAGKRSVKREPQEKDDE